MTIFFVIICFIAAYSHGIHEGMIMTQDYDIMHNYAYPGVRGHNWFGWYHAISSGRNIFFILLGSCLFSTIIFTGIIVVSKLIPGIFFLVWELAEVGYAQARGGKPIYYHHDEPYEHIYFLLWHKIYSGNIIYILHAIKIVVGVTLLLGGALL